MKRLAYPILCTALMALAACTEKPQTAGAGQLDQPAYRGSGSNFTASDWTPGDRTSWEQQLKVRAQRGQNEYNKTSSGR